MNTLRLRYIAQVHTLAVAPHSPGCDQGSVDSGVALPNCIGCDGAFDRLGAKVNESGTIPEDTQTQTPSRMAVFSPLVTVFLDSG